MIVYVIKKEASISYERPYYFDYCDSSLKGYTTKNSFKYKLHNNDLGELVKDINDFGWTWKECSSSFSAIIFNSTSYKRKKDN